jgi:hypothetical protein
MKKVFLYLFIFFLIILGIYFYRDFSQKSSQTPQPSETVSKKSPYIIPQPKPRYAQVIIAEELR